MRRPIAQKKKRKRTDGKIKQGGYMRQESHLPDDPGGETRTEDTRKKKTQPNQKDRRPHMLLSGTQPNALFYGGERKKKVKILSGEKKN